MRRKTASRIDRLKNGTGMALTDKTLHVHCGDNSAAALRQSGVPGHVLVIHDPVLEGPTPEGAQDAEWYALRAQYLASIGVPFPAEELARKLAKEDRALDDLDGRDEVVLWFDHCLFDQMILIRLLARLAPRNLNGTAVGLICIGDFPGFTKFCGLGELTPAQLASLTDKCSEVTLEQKNLAAEAWSTFCAPDPRGIERLLTRDTSVLPYLRAALARHLEQYPSVRNGLNRLENEILQAVAEGQSDLTGIFRFVCDRETSPFLGDTMLWSWLDRLARAPQPAVIVKGPGPIPRWDPPADVSLWSVALTDVGQQLLDGRADWVRMNGIDRWLGGVYLHGPEAAWRWDEEARRLVGESQKGGVS